jgi:hypothetical protein
MGRRNEETARGRTNACSEGDSKYTYLLSKIDIAKKKSFGSEARGEKPCKSIGGENRRVAELTEALQQYEAAVNAESEAEVAFSAAVVEAGLEADTDADDDGVADDFDPETNDYVLLAESDLLTAQQALNAARRINTDAKLAQNVVDAQKLVSDDTAKYSVDGVDVATIKKVYQITDAGTSVLNANGFYTEDAAFGDAVTKLVGYVDPTDTTDDLVIDGTSSEVTVDDAEDAGGANVDNSTSTVTDLLITTTYSALQLQSRLSAAEASLAGNIASKGETADLADQLNDDIALYQANNPVNGDLTTLQTALQTYLAKVEAETVTDADVVTVLEAASVAQAAIFDAKGNSLLADGATGDSIESLVSILDTRDTLSDAVTAADTAFQATANGAALVIAENAVETREGLIQAVADKQADVEAVTEAADAYAAAQDAVTAAGEELGYTIEAIDSGIEFATDEADLFTFDAKDLENTPDVVINDLASDDLIYLGSDYALGVEGSADNNALEVFLTEVNGNAVLQVENTTFGSASDDFTEITLTGVAAADVTIENGVVSIVEVA